MGRLASDIGGTFTDLVYFDEESGELKVEKSLTTPKDLTRGVEDTIRLAELSTGHSRTAVSPQLLGPYGVGSGKSDGCDSGKSDTSCCVKMPQVSGVCKGLPGAVVSPPLF